MRHEDAQALAERLIKEHLPEGWTFIWTKQTRGFGKCWTRSERIGLSKANTPHETDEAVEQTLLHEIAHGIAGEKHGHDREWKRIARSIGVKNPKATRARTCAPENAPTPTWVLLFGEDILIEYLRKPPTGTFETLHRRQMEGRPETLGKLQLVSYTDYQRGVRTMTGVKRKVYRREPVWVMVYDGEIVKRYYRKPNKRVFNNLPNLYLPKRGRHTMGKLEIISYRDYQRAMINRMHFE